MHPGASYPQNYLKKHLKNHLKKIPTHSHNPHLTNKNNRSSCGSFSENIPHANNMISLISPKNSKNRERKVEISAEIRKFAH